jgi:WhiB family redox-sensing transcriptional regulator
MDWQRAARCRGDAGRDFYPPFGGENKRERLVRELRAKAVCEPCPVRAQCLDHALSTGERHGVWGGLSADERLGNLRSA